MEDQIDSKEELEQLQQLNQALRENADLKQEKLNVQEKVIDLQMQAISGQEKVISAQQERMGLQDETINLQREQIKEKDQLIAKLQKEAALLTRQLQARQETVDTDRYDSQVPSSSGHFPRPSKKSLLKKRRRQRS